jgi:hypothetical protein
MPQYPENGSEADKRVWRGRMDIYKIQTAKWEQQSKSLDAVNEWIITNLDPAYYTPLLNYRTPYSGTAKVCDPLKVPFFTAC